jgi:hypothetical protein
MTKHRALPNSVPPPSPNALHRATLTLQAVRAQLLAIDPTIVEDLALFTDTLDGEGGNALDVIADMVRAALDAEAMGEALKERASAMAARKARLERRATALRQGVLDALLAVGLPKLEREDFTASVGNGYQKVLITEIKLVPDAYVKTTREPMKTEIGAALKAGTAVPGAVLSNAGNSLTVRVR